MGGHSSVRDWIANQINDRPIGEIFKLDRPVRQLAAQLASWSGQKHRPVRGLGNGDDQSTMAIFAVSWRLDNLPTRHNIHVNYQFTSLLCIWPIDLSFLRFYRVYGYIVL